jgi:hypothetical protein
MDGGSKYVPITYVPCVSPSKHEVDTTDHRPSPSDKQEAESPRGGHTSPTPSMATPF